MEDLFEGLAHLIVFAFKVLTFPLVLIFGIIDAIVNSR
jgi:hypothetical protein